MSTDCRNVRNSHLNRERTAGDEGSERSQRQPKLPQWSEDQERERERVSEGSFTERASCTINTIAARKFTLCERESKSESARVEVEGERMLLRGF